MGLLKGKSEGGAGGKRGHSNMDHWGTTDEIKATSRKRRRLHAKNIIVDEQHEDVPRYLCNQCSATLPAIEVSAAVRGQVSQLVRSGAMIQAMDLLRRNRMSLNAAKAVCTHVSPKKNQCHRCSEAIERGEYVECSVCYSFNYNW